MKTEQLKAKIKEIIDNEPRFIDQISTRQLKEKLAAKKEIKCSIPMLNKVMLSITSETPDGYPVKTGGNLVMGDEHGYGDSKMKGLHKYGWFVT